jgi:antitoxin component of MazEF toxin-antitoxin module
VYVPIIRKILEVGNSKAITIPKSWLELYERETGEKITKVTIEVNRVLIIAPLLKKEKGENRE